MIPSWATRPFQNSSRAYFCGSHLPQDRLAAPGAEYCQHRLVSPDQSLASEQMRDPYIAAFMHSRHNEASPFTQGPQDRKEFYNYQHPDYLQDGNPHHVPEFNRDSLGTLLLEASTWDSLSNKLVGQSFKGLFNHECGQHLVERWMPQLEHALGTIYPGAPRGYFESSFLPPHLGNESVPESYAALYNAFKTLVVDRIGMCKV